MDDLDMPPGALDIDSVVVRALAPTDLDWIVRIDAQRMGRPRPEYYKLKLAEAAPDTGVRVSLAATLDEEPAGFLMARVYYGDFGRPEPSAILDAIGVSPAFARRNVARALLHQLETNLRGLGIERLETQVDWQMTELIAFFQRAGFRPAARLCLEKTLA